jgi:hypothetical protein
MKDILPKDFRPSTGIKAHRLDSSIVWMENGIFFIFSLPNIDHTLEHSKIQTNFFLETYVDGDSKLPMICDVRIAKPIKKDVRDYYSSPEGSANIDKFAFLVDSPVSRVIANFFINIRVMPLQMKMFNSVGDAVDWCKSDS